MPRDCLWVLAPLPQYHIALTHPSPNAIAIFCLGLAPVQTLSIASSLLHHYAARNFHASHNHRPRLMLLRSLSASSLHYGQPQMPRYSAYILRHVSGKNFAPSVPAADEYSFLMRYLFITLRRYYRFYARYSQKAASATSRIHSRQGFSIFAKFHFYFYTFKFFIKCCQYLMSRFLIRSCACGYFPWYARVRLLEIFYFDSPHLSFLRYKPWSWAKLPMAIIMGKTYHIGHFFRVRYTIREPFTYWFMPMTHNANWFSWWILIIKHYMLYH